MAANKEERYMALTGAIPGNKEIANEMRKDLAMFPGLRTKLMKKVPCKRCGWCCDTRVLVDDKEISRIRKFLKMGKDEFISKYVEILSGDYYFPRPCPFLGFDKDNKAECAIYPVRPGVCEDFPIMFMTLTVGKCHVGNELEIISKEWFDEFARSLGVDPNSPRFHTTSDEVKKAAAKLEQLVTERQGDKYDPNDNSCKKMIIYRHWLKNVLDHFNKKEIRKELGK